MRKFAKNEMTQIFDRKYPTKCHQISPWITLTCYFGPFCRKINQDFNLLNFHMRRMKKYRVRNLN